jgi:hypothetical protein
MAHLEYRLDRYAAAEAEANAALALAQEAGDHRYGAVPASVGLPALGRRRAPAGFPRRLGSTRCPLPIRARRRRPANQSLAEKSMGHYDAALRFSCSVQRAAWATSSAKPCP